MNRAEKGTEVCHSFFHGAGCAPDHFCVHRPASLLGGDRLAFAVMKVRNLGHVCVVAAYSL